MDRLELENIKGRKVLINFDFYKAIKTSFDIICRFCGKTRP